MAAVDGNVLRVYTRFFEDERDISKEKTKKEIEAELSPIMPVGCSGDFNQAMMELGATVCVPNGAPKCENCPVAEICKACRNGSWESFPRKVAKKPRRIEEKTVLLIYRDNQVLIRKRGAQGLLAGLYEFPNVEGYAIKKKVLEYVKRLGLQPLQIKTTQEAKHIFSHVEWHMKGYEIKVDETTELPQDCLFINVEQLREEYSVPSAFVAYKNHFLERNM